MYSAGSNSRGCNHATRQGRWPWNPRESSCCFCLRFRWTNDSCVVQCASSTRRISRSFYYFRSLIDWCLTESLGRSDEDGKRSRGLIESRSVDLQEGFSTWTRQFCRCNFFLEPRSGKVVARLSMISWIFAGRWSFIVIRITR